MPVHPVATAEPPVIELRRVAKAFGPAMALRAASLTLRAGSVHALVGENGAGKTTLVNVIAGVLRPDGGRFELDGEQVRFASAADARAAGIAVIHQKPTLFPHLSVVENIYLGHQPTGAGGRIDRRSMRDEVLRLFGRLGVRIDPDLPANVLTVADRQVVEIARALTMRARILVMDEATSALTGAEVARLFAIVRSLRDDGRAILFVSHRFREIFELCDTVTVMRDGMHIATTPIAKASVSRLVDAMVGRDATELYPKQPATIGDVVLDVSGLSRLGRFRDVSFSVRAGEIVGLAGIVGSGRSALVRSIFGVDRYDTGRILMEGVAVPPRSPTGAIRRGMALVPQERRREGLIPTMSIAGSITLAARNTIARHGVLSGRMERGAARLLADRVSIRTTALTAPTSTLGGGNQQRLMLAKWLATDPRLLIVDEPTRGIDIAAKADVHRLLGSLAAEGMAILMVSSELPEVLGMSDRVIVMREGGIAAEYPRTEATPEAVMRAATGE